MVNKYDVIVIGGGPSGTTAARYAASEGLSVLLLEKDRDIGYPVRCGEAVSRSGIQEFLEPDPKFIASEIHKFSIIAPNGAEVLLPLDETVYVLERRIFDYELAKMAAREGAVIKTRAYVSGLLFDESGVSGVKYEFSGQSYDVKSSVVIACDGVESRVGRWAGIPTACSYKEMESCAQVTAGGIPLNDDTCYFYFGQDYAPGGYLWVFPKGKDSANVGLGLGGELNRKKSAISYLNDFMDRKFPEASRLSAIAGGVPCCPSLKKIYAPGILLAGDAARQVNPLTGGGIISGMIGGMLAGKAAARALKSCNPGRLQEYEKDWEDRLGNRHQIFNRIKDGVFNFSDDKFNSIASPMLKIPIQDRTFAKLFRTALVHSPSLLLDAAKVFLR